MPAKHPRLDEPERRLADRLMSIAESRSVRALGVACCSAIGELTGSPTVGLYLLEGAEPDLVYSRHVEEGFLDNYKSGFWKCDPVLDCILTAGRTTDGASLLGPHHWRRSASCELLHEWGFSYNMGGPLRCENKIVGVLFTATPDAAGSLYAAGAATHGHAVPRGLAGAHQHDECRTDRRRCGRSDHAADASCDACRRRRFRRDCRRARRMSRSGSAVAGPTRRSRARWEFRTRP